MKQNHYAIKNKRWISLFISINIYETQIHGIMYCKWNMITLFIKKNYITLYSVIKLSNDSKMYVKVKKKAFMKIR